MGKRKKSTPHPASRKAGNKSSSKDNAGGGLNLCAHYDRGFNSSSFRKSMLARNEIVCSAKTSEVSDASQLLACVQCGGIFSFRGRECVTCRDAFHYTAIGLSCGFRLAGWGVIALHGCHVDLDALNADKVRQ